MGMTFKKLKLTKPEKIWLQEVLKKNFKKIEEDDLKINLRNQLPKNFNPENLDQRVYKYGRLTLVGLWHIDSSNHLFKVCEKIIRLIKGRIIDGEKPKKFKTGELALELNETTLNVGIGLLLLNDLGFVKAGSWIENTMALQDASLIFKNAYHKYLYFESLESGIENYFQKNKPSQNKVIKSIDSKNSISNIDQIWNDIEAEYNLNKDDFSRKISFVKDEYKRRIIFRDVAHAYFLQKNNFHKAAVLLAGGVIEELLRLYLDHHTVKPQKNRFDSYIKACKENELLINALSNLSDSARHFRNFVHLEKEKSERHELKPSNAIGAVSSIFSIANGFS